MKPIEFYQDALAETQCKLVDCYGRIEKHSSGTPNHREIGRLIQSLRQEMYDLRKLAYPETYSKSTDESEG
jgi:hypothetical protein